MEIVRVIKLAIMAMDKERRGEMLDVELHLRANTDDPIRLLIGGEPYGLSPQGNRGRTDR